MPYKTEYPKGKCITKGCNRKAVYWINLQKYCEVCGYQMKWKIKSKLRTEK